MTCHQLLSLTPELKKKIVFAVCVNVLQRTSIKNRGSWRITTQLTKFLWHNQFYWNEMKFLSPWKLQDLSLSLPFDPFSPLHWWFPLESSSIVCMIAFSFPRIIYFNFLQMKADAFSQRQQFPYFRNSLL